MTDELPEGHYPRWPSEDIHLRWPSEDIIKRYGAGVFSVGHIERVTEDPTGLHAECVLTTDAFKRNEFSIFMEDFSTLRPYQPRDNPFRNYTPFPKLDAAERKARAAAIEGRERLVAAWKVLRSGDRDPFGEGCDCW